MRKYQLFIGIDISKLWIDVCVSLDGNKSHMVHKRYDNADNGFRAMLGFIQKHQGFQCCKSKWIVCMEHTGIYTLPLCKFLEKKAINYTLINAHHLNKSLGLRRGKSDPADAADIARYAYRFEDELKLTKLPSDKLLIIKNLLSLRHRLVKYKSGLSVAAKELEDFAPNALSKDVVAFSKQNIKQHHKTIQAIEKKIVTHIEQDAELSRLYDLLLSITGVGFVIAATMIVYTLAFTAFPNSRKFATYIGFAPFAKSSGTSLNAPAAVSYLAHKKLKGLLSCGASSAIVWDKELNAYYHRQIEKGKNKFKVRNAVRNKFLHRIFAVVKRGTPFVKIEEFRSQTAKI